jgi:hypothetical protein
MNLGISIQELALYGLVIAITCLAIFIFTMIMHTYPPIIFYYPQKLRINLEFSRSI